MQMSDFVTKIKANGTSQRRGTSDRDEAGFNETNYENQSSWNEEKIDFLLLLEGKSFRLSCTLREDDTIYAPKRIFEWMRKLWYLAYLHRKLFMEMKKLPGVGRCVSGWGLISY
jgi:hypothetical protein